MLTEELVLPCHACCVLFPLRFNGHSLLLNSYLSRIGRIENPSCSTCRHSSQDTTHLILHCPAMDSLATLCPSTTSALECCPVSSAPWFSAMLPSLGKGWVSTTSNKNRIYKRPICSLPCLMWIVINLKFCLNILLSFHLN